MATISPTFPFIFIFGLWVPVCSPSSRWSVGEWAAKYASKLDCLAPRHGRNIEFFGLLFWIPQTSMPMICYDFSWTSRQFFLRRIFLANFWTLVPARNYMKLWRILQILYTNYVLRQFLSTKLTGRCASWILISLISMTFDIQSLSIGVTSPGADAMNHCWNCSLRANLILGRKAKGLWPPPLPELPCDPQPSKRTMNSRGIARNVKKLGDKQALATPKKHKEKKTWQVLENLTGAFALIEFGRLQMNVSNIPMQHLVFYRVEKGTWLPARPGAMETSANISDLYISIHL